MIESLEIKNWRTHHESTFTFGKGTNVIVGVMGSGKSSIVNAISYSLFGTFPQLKSKQVTLNEIIMNKPNPCSKAETTLFFSHGEDKYRVERIINADSTNEAKLYKENRLIAGPKQKDVNEKIELILGLSYELFSRAVYAEQNEIDFFLKLSPGERKKKFDELLELEKYENARKNALTLQNQFNKENKDKNESVLRQKENIKSHEEEKIVAKIKEEEQMLKELEEISLGIGKEIIEKEKEYLLFEQKEKKHLKLKEEIISNKALLENIEKDVKENQKINLEEIIKEIDKIKKETTLAVEEQNRKEKECEKIESNLKVISEEGKVISYRKSSLEKEIKEISFLHGNCPKCKQKLTEEHKKDYIEKAQKEIKQITEEEKETDKKINDLKKQITLLEKETEEIRKIVDEKKRELFSLQADEKQAKSIDAKKKQLLEIQKQLPIIEKEIKEVGFDSEKLSKARKDFFELKTKKELALAKTKSSKELIESHRQTLEKICLIKKSITEMEEEIKRTDLAAKKLGVFGNCLMATQVELRQALLETINEAMSNIWNNIYPYKDFVDARLCVVENGYDLQVLTRNNSWIRVEGILSGGERSAAALCIRIAFSLVLTKQLSMLILDEPTHNLDSNAIQRLSSMLRDDLPKLVTQIFVITHEKELESAATSNLYLLQRNKDLDEATKSEQISNY